MDSVKWCQHCCRYELSTINKTSTRSLTWGDVSNVYRTLKEFDHLCLNSFNSSNTSYMTDFCWSLLPHYDSMNMLTRSIHIHPDTINEIAFMYVNVCVRAESFRRTQPIIRNNYSFPSRSPRCDIKMKTSIEWCVILRLILTPLYYVLHTVDVVVVAFNKISRICMVRRQSNYNKRQDKRENIFFLISASTFYRKIPSHTEGAASCGAYNAEL